MNSPAKCLILTVLVIPGLVLIGQTGIQAGNKTEDGYVSLFNGKDLTGWSYYKQKDLKGQTKTEDGRFSVEDGIIVANEGKGIKNLYSIEKFSGDCHLILEFRAAEKADSGVYIRGPQLQVRDFKRRNEQKQLKKFKNDDWNVLDITVKSGVVVTKVNGKTLSEKDSLKLTVERGQPQAMLNGKSVDVKSIQVSVNTIARCLVNGEVLNKAFNVGSNGPIGLQAERGKFEFRNIRLKVLSE